MSPKKRYKFTGHLSVNGYLQSDQPLVGKGRFIRLRNHLPEYVLDRLVDNLVTIEIVFGGDGKPAYENFNRGWESFSNVLRVDVIPT